MGTEANNAFKAWYKENGESHNQSRKKRYQHDPVYRDKVKKQSAATRAGKRKKDTGGSLTTRVYKRKEIRVYKISEVAFHLDRSIQVIRQWESKGLIPVPIFNEFQRLYTDNQLQLMGGLVKVLTQYRYNRVKLKEALTYQAATIKLNWKKVT